MAINTQTIRVDLNTGRSIPTVFTHQNDTNRQLTFQLYNNGEPFTPSSTTVKFAYKSPIVNGQYSVITGSQMASGTVSGNTVTVTLPAAYTQVSGVGLLTMILSTSGNTLRPVNIKFVCQSSADGDDQILNASDWPEGLYDYMDDWLAENEPTEIANLKSDLNQPYSPWEIQITTNGVTHSSFEAKAGTTYLVERTESTTGDVNLRVYNDGTSVETKGLVANRVYEWTPSNNGTFSVYAASTAVPCKVTIINTENLNYRVTKIETDEIPSIRTDIQSIQDDIADKKKSIDLSSFTWEQGVINSSGANDSNTSLTRTRTKNAIQVTAGATVENNDSSLYKFGAFLYSDENCTTLIESKAVSASATTFTTTTNGYLRLTCGTASGNISDPYLVFAEKAISIDAKSTALIAEYSMLENGILSAYKRNGVYYGGIPFNWYVCQHDVFGTFTRETTTAEYITALDTLVSQHSDYVTKKTIGTASDNQSIYLYDFMPDKMGSIQSVNTFDIPTVMIIASQHGEEKGAAFGWYELINDLLNNWNKNPLLEYLRTNVHILFVPIVNTYGFDNVTRKNANGVDINRNYSAGWSATDENNQTIQQSDSRYPGAAPFDQPETIAIRNLILEYSGSIDLFIDNHTNTGNALSDYNNLNWISLAKNSDNLYGKFATASVRHIIRVSNQFKKEYSISYNGYLGSVTSKSADGTAKDYALSQKIIACTFEGFAGFVGGERYTDYVKSANAEIIGNYICESIEAISN